jgi:hypothetical protein
VNQSAFANLSTIVVVSAKSMNLLKQTRKTLDATNIPSVFFAYKVGNLSAALGAVTKE